MKKKNTISGIKPSLDLSIRLACAALLYVDPLNGLN